MARLELHLLWAGAGSLIAAIGLGGAVSATDLGAPAAPAPSAMASYVETETRPAFEAGSSSREIFPEADGLFYVEAVLGNGNRMRFLVDTGASVTVLTARDAKMMGIAPDGAPGGSRLRTAGGVMTAKSATIGRMAIAGRELRDIEVAIIENGLPVSLLGQNALSELGTITLGNGRLIIS